MAAAASAPVSSATAMQMPLIISHRGGVHALLPEHSIGAYALGAELGADILEPDVVASADGVLVCLHDAELSTVTDIASRSDFRNRSRQRAALEYAIGRASNNSNSSGGGSGVNAAGNSSGWWVGDFRLEELLQLRLQHRECVEGASKRCSSAGGGAGPFDDIFGLVTLRQLLQLAVDLSKQLGRPVGVAPEIKAAEGDERHSQAMEAALLQDLLDAGFVTRDGSSFVAAADAAGPTMIQSASASSLQRLRGMTAGVRLMQIVEQDKGGCAVVFAGGNTSEAALRHVASYAHVLALPAQMLVDAQLPRRAAAAGLRLAPWTLASDPSDYERAVELRAEAIFTDSVGAAVALLEAERHRASPSPPPAGDAAATAGTADGFATASLSGRFALSVDALSGLLATPQGAAGGAAIFSSAGLLGCLVGLCVACLARRSTQRRTVFSGHQFHRVYSQ